MKTYFATADSGQVCLQSADTKLPEGAQLELEVVSVETDEAGGASSELLEACKAEDSLLETFHALVSSTTGFTARLFRSPPGLWVRVREEELAAARGASTARLEPGLRDLLRVTWLPHPEAPEQLAVVTGYAEADSLLVMANAVCSIAVHLRRPARGAEPGG